MPLLAWLLLAGVLFLLLLAAIVAAAGFALSKALLDDESIETAARQREMLSNYQTDNQRPATSATSA